MHLQRGDVFGAILAVRQKIQKRTSTSLNNVDQVGQACGNCGRAHPPRACPAYKDACKFCGKIGHWKTFFRKRKGTNRPKEDGKQRGDTKSDGKQHRDAGKSSRRRDRRFHDLLHFRRSPLTAYAYPVYATIFSQHWMLSALEKRACARSNSRSILELRGTHSPLGHTSRCTRHSPQKTSLSPQGTLSWLPTMVRRSPV